MVDLHAQYLSIRGEVDDAIANVIANSVFVRGPHVDKFEEVYAQMFGIKHCISCANGTDALYIAMMALGIKYGDEVIVPAQSWIATSETVTQAGGRVIFCDIDPDTFTLNPQDLESKINARTVGVIPVHLYGQPADMDSIMEIAQRHNLWVIEDCAQSHLAKYKNSFAGTFGNISTFSFYPGKNLGAMGDAGAILTRDSDLAIKMAMFARHGGLTKGDHTIEGVNSRMDGIQAAILNAKIPHLADWTRRRQEIANAYMTGLSGIRDLVLPVVKSYSEHAWHLFVIKHERRDLLSQFLGARGIATSINYPVSLPFLPAYQRYGHTPLDFPNSYHCQHRILSLPIYPEMSSQVIDEVIGAIKEFHK
jgi:dTDP-4-amino-4,6-dideoxygalactose transaminase